LHKSRSTTHAIAARSSFAVLIKDLREEERQRLRLRNILDEERAKHEKHVEDITAAHARDLAVANKNHMRQLAAAEAKHRDELTRVKLWCAMNQPRPNELSRVLERQRRSRLEAEVKKMKEEADMKTLWNETKMDELERENNELKHQLARIHRKWADMTAWFSSSRFGKV
jgi:hypothetical protein